MDKILTLHCDRISQKPSRPLRTPPLLSISEQSAVLHFFNHTCLPHKAYNERKFCPTPETLENLRRAEEGMKLAQQELVTYLDRPDRRFSAEEREENRRLLKRVSQSLEEYFQAFEQAC
jgi:hypothetical protein